jgi:hypothetical protein
MYILEISPNISIKNAKFFMIYNVTHNNVKGVLKTLLFTSQHIMERKGHP